MPNVVKKQFKSHSNIHCLSLKTNRHLPPIVTKMADFGFGITKYQLFCGIQLLVLLQIKVISFQHKVGGLDAWGIPTAANKYVYTNWPKKQNFKLGDSLLFLYPPSQDSVVQVSEEAFKICNLKDPILYMNDGNSLFNITSPGRYYFTSGEPGHCEKSQKLEISVLNADGSALPPSSDTPSGLPDSAPSYQNAFGAMPSTSSAKALQVFSALIVVVFGRVLSAM